MPASTISMKKDETSSATPYVIKQEHERIVIYRSGTDEESHLGLDGLGLADEELDEGGVMPPAGAGAKVGGVVGRAVERVPGPLDEAEDNGVLLPRQELPHRVEAEPSASARGQELQ
jgi:hypothetical protein